MDLDITDAAIADLRSIRAYTLDRWGEEQEARYLDEMWDRFEEILTDPKPKRVKSMTQQG
jgi:plasmid stabilization system protein ParE